MKDVLKAMLVTALLLTGSPALAQFGGLGGALKKAAGAEREDRRTDDLRSRRAQYRRGRQRQDSRAVRRRAGRGGSQVRGARRHDPGESSPTARIWPGPSSCSTPTASTPLPRLAVSSTSRAARWGSSAAKLSWPASSAHEIGHVTRKHTINAIRKNKAVQMGTKETLSDRAPLLDQLANRAYEMVLENNFDRGDELDADKVSVDLTQKVGYASGSLGDFLVRLDDRNKNQPEKNGLFASHPETKERIAKIKQMAAAKNGALVEARYKSNVKYEPMPITSIAAVPDGASGLTGSTKSAEQAPKKDESKDAPKEEPKKKGFGIGLLKPTVAPEKESAQVSASGGARGVGPDRAAKGGGNPAIVKSNVTAGELATFKQAIA